MSTIYGPVPSWRFGRSLGIDVILPPKTCTLSCIYCQLGSEEKEKENLKSSNIADAQRVKNDLNKYLEEISLDSIDAVTFSGTGEPTLNPNLYEISKEVRKIIGKKTLVILTNATLLYKKNVRDNLKEFDIVVAKMDAGDETTFSRINRPKSKSTTLKRVIEGIKQLKKEMRGKLALEVMLLRTTNNYVSNVFGINLTKLIKVVKDIDPDIIQLCVPYRPPSEEYVTVPSDSEFNYVVDKFMDIFDPNKIWAYGIHDLGKKKVEWKSEKNLEDKIFSLLKRRPCTLPEISRTLNADIEKTKKILNQSPDKIVIEKNKSGDNVYFFVKD